MRSLVVLGSGITALGVVREAYRLGLQCLLVDTRYGPAMSSRLATPVQIQQNDEHRVLADLLVYGSARTALIATEDRWLRFIVAHRGAIEDRFADILAPANEALRICLDKRAFAAWCRKQGLPAPRSWSHEELARVEVPALIRPAGTLHDRPDVGLPKAVFVQSLAEHAAWISRFQNAGIEVLTSESLLRHRVSQYSVPFARRDGRTMSFVARKVRPPAAWARTGTYVELCANEEVETLARRAIEALDFRGIGEVEILRSEDGAGCYLVEINARPWLQYSLAAASGHALLALFVGDSAQHAARKPQGAVRWLSFSADFYACFSSSEGLVRHGELSLPEYLKTVWQANAFAYFDWRDPWPALKDLAALARDSACAVLKRKFRAVPQLQRRS